MRRYMERIAKPNLQAIVLVGILVSGSALVLASGFLPIARPWTDVGTMAFLVSVPLLPLGGIIRLRKRRISASLMSAVLLSTLLFGILAQVATGVVPPDRYYLHDTATSGISPAGEYMNATQGSTESTLAFDTVGQMAYWYLDETWPTGGEDFALAAGNYTFNMYFGSSGVPWWDSNYTLRQRINISAGSSSIPNSYPVKLTFDHAQMVTDSKSQADGDDIRVVYWTGSANNALDRALGNGSSWNNASTTILFKTQAAIAASGFNTDHYLYFNHSTAASPPTNTPSARYFLNQSLGETQTSSTTYANKVQLQFTPSETSEHWVVVATWRQRHVGGLGTEEIYGEARITVNGAARTGTDSISYQAGGDVWNVNGALLKVNGTTAQQTIGVDFRANGGTDAIDRATILAFMIPDPPNADVQYAEDLPQVTDTVDPTDALTVTFTPSSAGDYIWMANAFHHEAPGSSTSRIFAEDETNANQQRSRETHISTAIFKTLIHFEERNLGASSQSFVIRHEPDTAGSDRRGLTQLLFRSDVFEGVENASSAAYETTTLTSYQTKVSLTTATQASDRDYVYLVVLAHDDVGAVATDGHFAEIRLAGSQQVETQHESDRGDYPTMITWGYAETNTGNRALDARYRAEFSSVTAEAEFAHILALRYKEPSLTLDPEETEGGGGSGDVDITVHVHHTRADGSDPQEIVTSSTVTIDENTTDPLVLNVGAGAEQAFKASDPRRLRLLVNVTAVNGSFVLAYNSTANPTNLETPVTGVRPLLVNPTLTPTSGTTTTNFNFTIDYRHPDGTPANVVRVNVSDATNGTYNNFTMTRIGNPEIDYFVQENWAINGTVNNFANAQSDSDSGASALLSQETTGGDDFRVERGTSTIGTSQTQVTITAGTDYTAPASLSSAFIRIVSSRLSGVGHDSLGGTQDPGEFMVSITNPENLLTSITFQRYLAPSTYNTRVYWEIVEYTGSGGGGNEFIVRGQDEIEQTSGTQMDGLSVSVSDDSDVVVFITGQRQNEAVSSAIDRALYTGEWVAASNIPRFTRGDGTGTASVSYAVVEFTGSNWKVQRSEHSYVASGVWETESITAVNSLSRALLHVQMRTGSGNLDEQGQQVYLSATNTISWRLRSGAGIASQVGVAWVVENIQTDGTPMDVQRISNTRASGGAEPDEWTETITAVTSLATTSIMGETADSGGSGSSVPRGSIGFRLTATNTVTLWRSDTGQTQDYRFEVVQWPAAPGGALLVQFNTTGIRSSGADKLIVRYNLTTSDDTFGVWVWNFTASDWTNRGTLDQTTVSFFNYTLTADEKSGGTLRIRFNDTSDSGSTDLSIDYQLVNNTLWTSGVTYYHNTTLAVGEYNHFFWANDTAGVSNRTATLSGPSVNAPPVLSNFRLENATAASRAGEQLDVDVEHFFLFNVTDESGWSDIGDDGNVSLRLWYDGNGSTRQRDPTACQAFGSNWTGCQNAFSSNDVYAQSSGLDIALIVGNSASLHPDRDVPILDHLEKTLGHSVTIKDDEDQSYDPTTFDAVVISESTFTPNTAWLKTEVVGILTVDGGNNDEFELGTGGTSPGGGDTDINITDNTHYITQVFPTGVLTVTVSTNNLGSMSGWANDVTKLAHYDSNATEAKLLAVETGGVLQGGTNTSADRRVFFGAQHFANLTADGRTLFNRSLDWVANNTVNIAFIVIDNASLHPDRDVPILDHLEKTLGHLVTIKDDNDESYDPTTFDAVVISESTFTPNTAWLKTEVVGILTVDGGNNDEFELGTGGTSPGGGDTDINITDNTHYITQVFPTGVLTVTVSTNNMGNMSGWANDVKKLAHYNSDSTSAKLLVVEKGGVLQGGTNTSADRRVFFGAQHFANLTADGRTLFNRSLDWVRYNTGAVSETERDTAWRDFGFALGSASINTVEVGVEWFRNNTAPILNVTVSWDGGTSWATNQTATNKSADDDTVEFLDFTSATAWDATKLNDANLRVRVGTNASGARLDYVTVRVISTSELAFGEQTTGANYRIELKYVDTADPSTASLSEWSVTEGRATYNESASSLTAISNGYEFKLALKLGFQVKQANDPTNSSAGSYNDANSWNGEVVATDGTMSTTLQTESAGEHMEFGVFMYTNVSIGGDWTVTLGPGDTQSTNTVTVTRRSNDDFVLRIWFVTHLEGGNGTIDIGNVQILAAADLNDNITADTPFGGLGEANDVYILGSTTWWFNHSTDTDQDTTSVQFSVTVPYGTLNGTYTAQLTIRIQQRPSG